MYIVIAKINAKKKKVLNTGNQWKYSQNKFQESKKKNKFFDLIFFITFFLLI